MQDSSATIEELKKRAQTFINERDWDQFHTLKNLTMNLTREASELMELFLWCEGSASQEMFAEKRQQIEEEAADVLFGLLCFCNKANIDLSSVFEHKLKLAAQKYPIEKSKGSSKKYTDF